MRITKTTLILTIAVMLMFTGLLNARTSALPQVSAGDLVILQSKVDAFCEVGLFSPEHVMLYVLLYLEGGRSSYITIPWDGYIKVWSSSGGLRWKILRGWQKPGDRTLPERGNTKR